MSLNQQLLCRAPMTSATVESPRPILTVESPLIVESLWEINSIIIIIIINTSTANGHLFMNHI